MKSQKRAKMKNLLAESQRSKRSTSYFIILSYFYRHGKKKSLKKSLISPDATT